MDKKPSKASVIGGLVGLVLSETVVHMGQSINGGVPNPQLRMGFDALGYSIGAGLGYLITSTKDLQKNGRFEKANSWKDTKYIVIDYILMWTNIIVPAAYSIHTIVQCDGQLPYIK